MTKNIILAGSILFLLEGCIPLPSRYSIGETYVSGSMLQNYRPIDVQGDLKKSERVYVDARDTGDLDVYLDAQLSLKGFSFAAKEEADYTIRAVRTKEKNSAPLWPMTANIYNHLHYQVDFVNKIYNVKFTKHYRSVCRDSIWAQLDDIMYCRNQVNEVARTIAEDVKKFSENRGF